MATYDEPPRWSIILADLIARAERELGESKKKGASPAPNTKTEHPPHPVKSEVNEINE